MPSTHTPETHDARTPSPARASTTDLWWLLLVLGVVGNAVASGLGVGVLVHLVLGAATAVSAVVLVTRKLRGRW